MINPIKNKEKLSNDTSKYLFAECLNDIDRALNGAREAAKVNPTEKNKRILYELEVFFQDNEAYYNGLILRIRRYKSA